MSAEFPVDVSGWSHPFVSAGTGGGEGELVAAVQRDLARAVCAMVDLEGCPGHRVLSAAEFEHEWGGSRC